MEFISAEEYASANASDALALARRTAAQQRNTSTCNVCGVPITGEENKDLHISFHESFSEVRDAVWKAGLLNG